MMHKIHEGKIDSSKGVWSLAQAAEKLTALMSCPTCGRTISLSTYEILPDGCLEPSVVCPYSDCTFHQHCQLWRWAARVSKQDEC